MSTLDDETRLDGPHGWIQWKGTGVCMDVHCSCGALTHLDAEFAYMIRCGACAKTWHVGAYVRLVEVLPGEDDSRAIETETLDEPEGVS